jgi:membrane-bound metal-dependent hydrolase YbcI (DUF457 family)
MLVGHHAVGFAAKRIAPLVPLGTLQVACVFPDLIVFVDQLLGIEHARMTPGITAFSELDGYDIAISHSLATSVVWSGLFALVYFWWRRDGRGSAALSIVVFSHWLLDFISHRAELPLVPGGGTYVGLGLWNSIPATFAVEGALWLLGIIVYLRATRSTAWRGTIGLVAFIAVLTVAWLATPLQSQPAGDFSTRMLLGLLLVYGVLLSLASWIERYRPAQAGITARQSFTSVNR